MHRCRKLRALRRGGAVMNFVTVRRRSGGLCREESRFEKAFRTQLNGVHHLAVTMGGRSPPGLFNEMLASSAHGRKKRIAHPPEIGCGPSSERLRILSHHQRVDTALQR